MRTLFAGCCARAASGQVAAAPPSSDMNSRRLMLSMALRSLLWRALSRVTRWPSGWNVDRQKHDYEDQDRVKRDFRNVETPTPPLLYSLLVHGRPPSVVKIDRSPHDQRATERPGRSLGKT